MILSKKALSIAPSPTLAIDEKAKAIKSKGGHVISFGVGEPDFDTPEFIKTAAKKAMDEGFTKYTLVGGTLELKSAIASYIAEDTGVYYNENQIIVSNGAKQSLYNALFCLINPGDEVIIPSPYWATYPEIVKLCNGKPVFVPTNEEEDFKLKANALKSALTEKTKIIIINTPNNPTGSVYSIKDLVDIAELALDNNLIIVADEIYSKLIYDDNKHISIPSLNRDLKEKTVLINGASKTFAMTGWRIGFAAGPENLIKSMNSFQSQTTSNPNSLAQKATIEALTNPIRKKSINNMVKTFEKRRNYIVDRINNNKYLSARLPKGAFYVMMNISKILGKKIDNNIIADSTDFAQFLLEKSKVAVVPGDAFGAAGYVRLSYATSMENIKEGLNRIEDFLYSLT